ncbi:hypothetical protein [Tsukamurella strandjordii]|uniref:hypothetical protein n=1 Tax=Tsukamurella strandjordii TaxID=147577 RepID=UPI0031D787A2
MVVKGRHQARRPEEAFGYVPLAPEDPAAAPTRTLRFWLTRIGGVITVIGGGIMVTGLLRGEDTDIGALVYAGCLTLFGLAAFWGAAAFGGRIDAPTPAPPAPPGAVRVRGRLGVQFFAVVVFLAAFLARSASMVTTAIDEQASATEFGFALGACGFSMVLCGFLGMFLLSMLRFRGVWIWWVGEAGVGVGGPEKCEKSWTEIRRIRHHAERNRLLVTYVHRWSLDLDDGTVITIEYPAEASPGSWRVKRAIRRLAPDIDLQ